MKRILRIQIGITQGLEKQEVFLTQVNFLRYLERY